MGRYRPHLEGGHSSVACSAGDRGAARLKHRHWTQGGRLRRRGAPVDRRGARAAPAQRDPCRRHGRAYRGWLPQRAPSCAAASITLLITLNYIYRPAGWALWAAHAQGSCGEGPTAATIAKPRAPSPPPLSPCPQLRPRCRNGGRTRYYTYPKPSSWGV